MDKKVTFQTRFPQKQDTPTHDRILSPLFSNSTRKLTDLKTISSKSPTFSSQIFNQKDPSAMPPLLYSLKLVKPQEQPSIPTSPKNQKSCPDTKLKEDPINPFIQAMLKNSNKASNKNILKIEKSNMQDECKKQTGEQRTTFRQVKKSVLTAKVQITAGRIQ